MMIEPRQRGEVHVVGRRERRAPVGIEVRRDAENVRAGEDRIVDAVAVEVVPYEMVRVASRKAAGGGPGILALHADRRHVPRRRDRDPVPVGEFLPQTGKEGPELGARVRERIVDVCVDEGHRCRQSVAGRQAGSKT